MSWSRHWRQLPEAIELQSLFYRFLIEAYWNVSESAALPDPVLDVRSSKACDELKPTLLRDL
ncbi:hypothetical protein ASG77_03410 [Arthrobacter sp. Soil762]|nr:hypothetical protein ASG77_03410 [Arthrobacter sp. Soil762]